MISDINNTLSKHIATFYSQHTAIDWAQYLNNCSKFTSGSKLTNYMTEFIMLETSAVDLRIVEPDTRQD
jgi:hypothetical protein